MVIMMGNAAKPDRDLIQAARDEASAIRRSRVQEAVESASVAIPGYELVRRVGVGAQGAVFEAVQQSTQRRVALKVIRAGAGWQRFEREVRLLARLQHPNIVAVYDSGTVDDRHFFAMELVPGQRLDDYVHHRGLDHCAVASLFVRICDAVHAAHQRGVMHRDLKPANVLVDEEGTPHILDFGLGKLLLDAEADDRTATAVTQDGQFLGTIAWASPEQVRGSGDDIDTRSDVYSLGVMLYAALVGVQPYDTSSSLQAAITNIVEVDPPTLATVDRSVDDDLSTIVGRCLKKEPAERYDSAASLAADLRRYLSNEPIEAKRDSRWYVLRKTLARYRALVTLTVVALLTGLGFGAGMTFLYQRAEQARQDAEVEAVELRAELKKLKASLIAATHWTNAFAAARALEKLTPEEGWQVLSTAWAEMREDRPKQQLLKAASVANPPYLLRVLHLGMTDPSVKVQEWAINYLRDIAFQDFASDYSAYERWYATYREQSLEDVLVANWRPFVEKLMQSDAVATGRILRALRPSQAIDDQPRLVAIAKEMGLVERLLDLFEGDHQDRNLNRGVAELIPALQPDEQVICRRFVPLIGDERRGARAVRLLGRCKARCAVEPIVMAMKSQLKTREGRRHLHDSASALAEIGAVEAIPTMIAIIDADNTYDTVYGVGYFGLGELTGVQYDESHDGKWWRTWWEKNKQRFPEAVRNQEIPTLAPVQRDAKAKRRVERRQNAPSAATAMPDSDDELPVQSLLAGGDPMKRYFLIGPGDFENVPAGGRPLLLVLPGGGGGEDFHPFVKRIAANAVDEHYLVAQLVAPQWSADQASEVVWPTVGLPWNGMRFSTEAFLRAVADDIGSRYAVDNKKVFALGWSSGGPPIYASLVAPDSPLKGAFIAMSVFKPNRLPDLSAAKGKAVYILHSPQDFIGMRFPEAARDRLAKAGASTKLVTYEGGHGWHGDVYGNIRAGVAWLESKSQK